MSSSSDPSPSPPPDSPPNPPPSSDVIMDISSLQNEGINDSIVSDEKSTPPPPLPQSLPPSNEQKSQKVPLPSSLTIPGSSPSSYSPSPAPLPSPSQNGKVKLEKKSSRRRSPTVSPSPRKRTLSPVTSPPISPKPQTTTSSSSSVPSPSPRPTSARSPSPRPHSSRHPPTIEEIAEQRVIKEKARQAKKSNVIRNAQKSGFVLKDYDREAEEKKNLKRLEKIKLDTEKTWRELNGYGQQEEKSGKSKGGVGERYNEIPLLSDFDIQSPLPVISTLMDKLALGRTPTLTYLSHEGTQQQLCDTEYKYLRQSLELFYYFRPSPINYKLEILWRFAVILADCPYGRPLTNMKLCHFTYKNILLRKCTAESHPYHYSAMNNSLILLENDIDRIELYEKSHKSNHDFDVEFPPFSAQYDGDKMLRYKFKDKLKKIQEATVEVQMAQKAAKEALEKERAVQE